MEWIFMNVYLEITRPTNALMAAVAVLLMAIINFNYGIPIILGFITVLFATSGGNVINDFFDYKIDKINKPQRPIPSGRISLKNAKNYPQFQTYVQKTVKYTHRKNVKAIDIICDALNAIAEQANTNQWIEKTPYYVYNLPLILTYFPDARIIWMIRDGRDVANSVLQKSWGANNIYYAAKAWQSANKINHARVYDQVVKVKYEEFLQTPITELTKIMNFLGFRCDDIDSLVENVNPAKMNQWRHTLTAKQITVFEAVAFDTLKEHGYETLNDCKPKLSKISILIYRLEHHVKLLKHLIKMNLIHPVKIKLGILKPFAEKN